MLLLIPTFFRKQEYIDIYDGLFWMHPTLELFAVIKYIMTIKLID